jgi:hypothetical protein
MRKKKPSLEFELILACTETGINNSAGLRIRALLNNPINWSEVIKIAGRQEILPFLYYSLSKLGLQNIIPLKISSLMQNCYHGNLGRNIRLEKEFSLILELADREGVRIIPFKGFSLVHTVYENLGQRAMDDIDILIQENTLQKICCVLKECGYREIHGQEYKSSWQGNLDEIVFIKELSIKQFVSIDVHSELVPRRPYKINLPCLWQKMQEKSIGGQRVFHLSSEDTFLSLALHIRRHARRLTLKFIIDIAELLNKNSGELNWQYIKQSAMDNHILTAVYFALYASQEILNVSIPEKDFDAFYPGIIKRAWLRILINRGNFLNLNRRRGILLRLLLFDSIWDLPIYLLRVSLRERLLGRISVRWPKKIANKMIVTEIREKTKK